MFSLEMRNTILPILVVATVLVVGYFGFGKFKTTQGNNRGTAIIFDLDGVLLKTSKMGAFKKLGMGNVLSYMMHGGSAQDLKKRAFDILFKARNEDPAKLDPRVCPTHEGQPMPTMMCEWQQGVKKPAQVLEEALACVEKLDREGYFYNDQEKELIVALFDIMFNPQTRLDITKPLSAGVKILKQCKDAGYQVYVLSNMDAPSMELLLAKYPEIFEQFDGIVYSADVKQIKPYNGIYEHLLSRYDLAPEQCIFLDNQKENTDAAQKLGITGWLCTDKSMKQLSKMLKKNINVLDNPQSIAQVA